VEDFQITFLDLLQAGSDTTSAFMECIILYMILYPEVQEKVNQEIQSVISPEQEVTYADAKRFERPTFSKTRNRIELLVKIYYYCESNFCMYSVKVALLASYNARASSLLQNCTKLRSSKDIKGHGVQGIHNSEG
jgi:hypothetical protein